MSERDPPRGETGSIVWLRPNSSGSGGGRGGAQGVVAFQRNELRDIMNVYGRMVAAGEWRDYAMDFGPDKAVFSIHRRTSEMPLYRVVKDPSLAGKQGQYSVVGPGGLILRRGSDLVRVLSVQEKKIRLVTS